MSNPSSIAATVIIDELVRGGVRDIVICPGSRSAPLARAAAVAAGSDGFGGQLLRLHVRFDERAAGFLALGLAAASGRPTPIIVTSGTAVANLMPAMVEAQLSSIPLLALTADRPLELYKTGANQTMDQVRFFENIAASELINTAAFNSDTFDPVDSASAQLANAQMRSTICRLLASMTSDAAGGPGHLDVCLREPLYPVSAAEITAPAGRAPLPENATGDTTAATGDTTAAADRIRAADKLVPWTQISRRLQNVKKPLVLDISRPTLVIAGDGAEEYPALADIPTIAEPTAYAPSRQVHPAAAGMLRQDPLVGEEGVYQLRPEQVVVVGRPTLHRGVAQLLAHPKVQVTVVTRHTEYTDVARTAHAVTADITVVGEQPKAWLDLCAGVDRLAADAVRNALQHNGFTGLHVAAAVADHLRVGDQLILGASNPVRDASYCGLPFDGVDVHANRGAAGIDGTIATAIGIALHRDRQEPDQLRAPRTVAFMGDLTFLHDAGALAIGPDEPRPDNLTIVVANDCGGGIFETLEGGRPELRDHFERIQAVPHTVDIEQLCGAYDIGYLQVSGLQELIIALDDDAEAGYGIRVIEARTDREPLRAAHAEIAAATTLGQK